MFDTEPLMCSGKDGRRPTIPATLASTFALPFLSPRSDHNSPCGSYWEEDHIRGRLRSSLQQLSPAQAPLAKQRVGPLKVRLDASTPTSATAARNLFLPVEQQLLIRLCSPWV